MRLAEVGPPGSRSDRAVGQILAGAEALAGARQQDDATGVVRSGAPDGGGEGFMQRHVERVHPVGPVEGQGEDALIHRFHEDGLRQCVDVSHGALRVPRPVRGHELTDLAVISSHASACP